MALVLLLMSINVVFHFQCMQYTDPSKPENPLDSPSTKIRVVFSAFGSLKYSGPSTLTTVVENLTISSKHVLPYTRRHSSHWSMGVPYESILIAVMNLWGAENPSTPTPSLFSLK